MEFRKRIHGGWVLVSVGPQNYLRACVLDGGFRGLFSRAKLFRNVADMTQIKKPACEQAGSSRNRHLRSVLLIALLAYLAIFLGLHAAGMLALAACFLGFVAAAAFFVFLLCRCADGERTAHGEETEDVW